MVCAQLCSRCVTSFTEIRLSFFDTRSIAETSKVARMTPRSISSAFTLTQRERDRELKKQRKTARRGLILTSTLCDHTVCDPTGKIIDLIKPSSVSCFIFKSMSGWKRLEEAGRGCVARAARKRSSLDLVASGLEARSMWLRSRRAAHAPPP